MKNSWSLMKQSCIVLFRNKKLLLFPLISITPFIFIVMFFFAGILILLTSFEELNLNKQFGENKTSQNISPIEKFQINKESTNKISGNTNSNQNIQEDFSISSVFLVLIYFISMIILTFFNTAFFNEIIHALNEQPVSIIGGLKFALSKWKSIILWALLASTVGILLRKIEENFGFIGKFVIGLIGMAWSVASVFAIPIMIRENQNSNPLDVLKKSGNLIKQKWGEGLIGYIGIETFGLLFFFSFSVICGLILALTYMMEFSGYYLIGIGVFWFCVICFVFYIQSIVNSIFKCALYLYASEGVLPLGFEEENINTVWEVKKK